MYRKPVIYAHRGASGEAPENTMAAFRRAIEIGSHGIECDVQLSSDGELMICHDERLERTTNGTGFLKDYSYRELRMLDAGSWFSEQYQGEPMPTLDELLALVKQAGILLNIEIKSGIVIYPNIEEKVVAAVKHFDIRENIVISSFNHYSIKHIKEIDPSIKTGILYMEGLYQPWDYMKTVGCECAHPFAYAIKPEIAEGLVKNGFEINVFTVDDVNMAKHFISMGVNGIITNYPDRMLNI